MDDHRYQINKKRDTVRGITLCGIAGFTSPDDYNDPQKIIHNMLSTIIHRGPDNQGVSIDNNYALGHVRLAIVDLSGGLQPRIDNTQKQAALVFNGEIYGYKHLALQLEKKGIYLQDSSDTEVLFNLLKHQGIDKTLEQIDGMFAFAYKEHERIILVRDRFGEKPLFYGIHNNRLVFASEIKAILQHPLYQSSCLDPTAISQYLTLEYLPGDLTGYKGIYKLLPGHVLVFEKGQAKIQHYWKPKLTHNRSETETEKTTKIETLLTASVEQRLVADVPVGVFLSGGLDSSLIAAFVAQLTSSVSAYTIKMPHNSFDETFYAKRIAKHLGMPINVIELESNHLLDALDTIDNKLDEPFSDSSLLPTYMLCKAASQSVTVALGGDGADELFAGYPNFIAQKFASLMHCFPEYSGTLLRYLLNLLPKTTHYMNIGFRLKQLSYGFGQHPGMQTYHWMSAFSINEQSRLWKPNKDIHFNLFSPYFQQLNSEIKSDNNVERLLYLLMATYLPDDILTKMDRASMYNSLEVRSPFLSKDFAEYVFSLNINDKLNGFETKYMLKKMAEKHLPRDIIYRKKHGFGLPITELIRGLFKEKFASVLLSAENPLMDWFVEDEINRYWKEHQSKKRDHGKKLLTLYRAMALAHNLKQDNLTY